jgi:hypothetical protein
MHAVVVEVDASRAECEEAPRSLLGESPQPGVVVERIEVREVAVTA